MRRASSRFSPSSVRWPSGVRAHRTDAARANAGFEGDSERRPLARGLQYTGPVAGATVSEPYDPTVYPAEERVGEEMIQRWIAELLRPLLERFLNRPGVDGPNFVGADQFVYYRQYDPHRRFAPDVYVLPGLDPATRVRSWKIWERGFAPSFALEVVSDHWLKDYVEAPERCDEAGIFELVVFDPEWEGRPRGEGQRWQVFRRSAGGRFEKVESHGGDRVWCESLQAWLRVVGVGDAARLRVGVGASGDALFPTEAEAQRAAKEAALAEKEAALARVRELEARLAAKDSD